MIASNKKSFTLDLLAIPFLPLNQSLVAEHSSSLGQAVVALLELLVDLLAAYWAPVAAALVVEHFAVDLVDPVVTLRMMSKNWVNIFKDFGDKKNCQQRFSKITADYCPNLKKNDFLYTFYSSEL